MRKSKFDNDQVTEILKKGEMGVPISELCNMHNISYCTYYRWKNKYNNDYVKKIDFLENENRKLEKLYEQSLVQREILQRTIEGKL